MNKNIKIVLLLSVCLISQIKGAELLDVKKIGEQQGYGEDSFNLSWPSDRSWPSERFLTKESKEQALRAILLFLYNDIYLRRIDLSHRTGKVTYIEREDCCVIQSITPCNMHSCRIYSFHADARLLSKKQGLELANMLQEFSMGRSDKLLKFIGRDKASLEHSVIAETLRDEISLYLNR
jgi:hypothetical protein